MTAEKRIIVGLGELVWDLLPAGKQIGGAPANFAYITTLLGDRGIPASRIGSDALGEQALQRLAELDVNAAFVQKDPTNPTGTVKVEVDKEGQPRFDILKPVAWDFLEWTPKWQQLAKEADAVCFGSLAQRSPQSRSTILSFLHTTRPATVRVFDVNLRQNFYSREILAESMKLANIVKLNHDELPQVIRSLELENYCARDMEQCLLATYDLELVCVTRGSGGSVLISSDERSEHAGFKVKVRDTVGAGDAFTAVLVHGYLRRKPLAQINEDANRIGAWVASESGATPALKARRLERILAEMG